MDILSTSPNQLYLFKTKNKKQLLEYDGKFFEKLNTQLKKFTELKIMDFSRLSKNLEKASNRHRIIRFSRSTEPMDFQFGFYLFHIKIPIIGLVLIWHLKRFYILVLREENH